MQIDKLYSSDLYTDTYGHYKYFNQHPWDVAMSRKVAEEFKYYQRYFNQEVINGNKDGNEYYVLLKIALDGPIIFFGD